MVLMLDLDGRVSKRVWSKLEAIERASDYPHEALKGNLTGKFKVRVGDHRLIYTMQNDGTLVFIDLGHRRDVYA